MKSFKFKINGNQYEVDIQSAENNLMQVEVNGSSYQIELEKAIIQNKTPKLVRTTAIPSTDSTPATAKTANPSPSKGSGTIKAPLPGVILNVHVQVGDVVKIGQRLITLEAMKMENNIDSDKDGKISEIKFRNGDSVMEGDVLIVIGG